MREIRGCTGRGKEFCGAGRVREGNFVGREKMRTGGNGAAGEERNGGKKTGGETESGAAGECEVGENVGGRIFCRRGGKILDFVSRFCLNSITMDKWASAVAGAFFCILPLFSGHRRFRALFYLHIPGFCLEAPVFLCQFQAGAAGRPAVFFTEEILCMI